VGESKQFHQAIGKIPLLAQSDTTILITGETGTGKELVARAVHYQSARHGKPFIPVNCGALPDNLFENELFGHIKGAFTDASSTASGLVAEAEGGTMLLDEVDTLSASAQVKLMRFLQDREYRPLGSPRNVIADVRIVAASNVDLWHQVQQKRVREDLFYRLNVLSIHLPPLRDRIEDIPLLAAHFLAQYASQYDRGPLRLSPGALQRILAYPWPGNVRELEGVIERAVILTSDSVLQPENIDLIDLVKSKVSEIGSFRDAKAQTIEQFERSYLTNLLSVHRGNITWAAKQAGKDRRGFQRLLRKYSLECTVFQKLT
jgi:DNA-binding NtrC family response regulator